MCFTLIQCKDGMIFANMQLIFIFSFQIPPNIHTSRSCKKTVSSVLKVNFS